MSVGAQTHTAVMGGPGVCTRDNAAKVGDEPSRSNKHVWAGTSDRARERVVEVGHEQSGLN